MPLLDSMRKKGLDPTRPISQSSRSAPLWKGPEEDGITFSLLSRFLVCRERFRILVVEGLRPGGGWNHRTGYGDMWHVCEEALAAGNKMPTWQQALQAHSQEQCRQYRNQQADIVKWYEVCKRQFPVYVQYWAKHKDVANRKPLLSEQAFSVCYTLPSGRVVRLRGKWDSVDLVGTGSKARIWLQENKTKGDVNEFLLQRQLTFDLQTMIYLTALTQDTGVEQLEEAKMAYGGNGMPHERSRASIAGVRYNVVRRPLSGGKGTIKQHEATKGAKCGKCKGVGKLVATGGDCPKCEGAGRVGAKPAETAEHFYNRLAKYIQDEPEAYFTRWNVHVTSSEIDKFRRECLDPILEQLCDWWEYINKGTAAHIPLAPCHWRHPFGVYNPMDEGNVSDLDEYLATGSKVGLQTTDNLFPEL